MSDLTCKQAGKRGGAATLARYGTTHFSKLASLSPHEPAEQARRGRNGGATTWERHGYDHYRAIGKAGGEKTKLLFGREHFAEAGRKGGRAKCREVAP